MSKYLFLLLFPASWLFIVGCSKKNDDDNGQVQEPTTTVFEMGYVYSDAVPNNDYQKSHNNLQSPDSNQLEQSSGLVGGLTNSDLIYICEGRNNPNEIHVFTQNADYRGKIVVVGATNIDWQDIAIGPGPQEGINYIYIGDIGDRQSNREFLSVYRFPEPDLSGQTAPFVVQSSGVERIDFTISQKRDFQTLMVDPITKDIIVMGTMQAMVYRLRYPQSTSSKNKADYKGHHRLRREIKAGDISPDGKYVLIKDVGEIFKWDIPAGEDPIKIMFEVAPTKVPYTAEIEGGALGWTANSNSYFTITDTDMRDGIRRGQPIMYGYTRTN